MHTSHNGYHCRKMKSVTRGQIQDKFDGISILINALGKGINPSVPSPLAKCK